MTIDGFYGEAPVDLGPLDLPDWHEFMHYLYLPVRIPCADTALDYGLRPSGRDLEMNFPIRLPERLRFLHWPVARALQDAQQHEHLRDPYVYVTARRGFATPGNPLNRTGWHCDDFGGTDLNYIWSDAYPTRFLLSNVGSLPISGDDKQSMKDMTEEARTAWIQKQMELPLDRRRVYIESAPAGRLLRLSPYVIHATPTIPKPGGMRSFFKISVSSHRYNLLGNSHNHLLDYDWPMVDRLAVRNQPDGNRDYVEVP